jgi:hypothetical protein
MRGTVEVAVGVDQAGALAAAMALPNVAKLTQVRVGGAWVGMLTLLSRGTAAGGCVASLTRQMLYSDA